MRHIVIPQAGELIAWGIFISSNEFVAYYKMLRKNVHSFCKVICCFQRSKSCAVNDNRQVPMSFTIVGLKTEMRILCEYDAGADEFLRRSLFGMNSRISY